MSGLRSLVSLGKDAIRPFVLPNAYVAPSATLIGKVAVADKSSILYNAVLRADQPNREIRVGAYTTVGEHSVVNSSANIGSYCRIGAGCVLEDGCEVGNEVSLGAGTMLGRGARVAQHVVTEPRTVVPDGGALEAGGRYAGNPAKRVGELTYDEKQAAAGVAERDAVVGTRHAYEFLPLE